MDDQISNAVSALLTTSRIDSAIKQCRTPDACLDALFTHVPGTVMKAKIAAGQSARGRLSSHDQARIGIIVAHAYRCEFSLSFHALVARRLGLNGAEIEANRNGFSHDASATELMRFCAGLLAQPGVLTEQQLRQLRWAGYGDEDIEESVLHLLWHAILCRLANRCASSDLQGQHGVRLGP